MAGMIFTIVAQLLGWYLKKVARDDQAKEDYIKFNEIMFRQGLSKTKMRLDSRNQIERVNEMWEND